MPEILALLQNIAPLLEKTTLRQMSHVIFGMLTANGRITMLGLSRWTEKGGSYRTIQRFYQSTLMWSAIHWVLFQQRFLKPADEYIGAGDETVISKAGKKTYGLDRFFAGLQQQVIPSISFFAFSLVNVNEEHSYPLQATQIIKSAEEKAASKAKAEARKVKPTGEKKKPGRPKGSKNKDKDAVVLNSELSRIQTALKSFIATLGIFITLRYVALDGHFGNYPSAWMVRQENLHLISKLRSDAALKTAFVGEHTCRGAKPKYGAKIDVRNLDLQYWQEASFKDGLRTDIYQGQFYNTEFAFPLNVVIIVKTNLATKAQAHVILFSTDLDLAYDKIIKFYSLRFQIEMVCSQMTNFASVGLENFG